MPPADCQRGVQFGVVLTNVAHHLRFDVVELLADRLDDCLHARAHDSHGQAQPFALGERYGGELAAPDDQRGQILLRDVSSSRRKRSASGRRARVAASSASVCASTRSVLASRPIETGEVAGLTRVDVRHFQARGLQRAGQRRLVAADRLHRRQHRLDGVQRIGQALSPSGSVTVARAAASPGTDRRHIDVFAGDVRCLPSRVSPDIVFGSLACACTLGRPACVTVRASSRPARRPCAIGSEGGLAGPSGYQAARSGPLASTGPQTLPRRSGLNIQAAGTRLGQPFLSIRTWRRAAIRRTSPSSACCSAVGASTSTSAPYFSTSISNSRGSANGTSSK